MVGSRITNYITFNEKIYVSILVSLSLRIDSFPIFSKKKNIKNLENEKRAAAKKIGAAAFPLRRSFQVVEPT